MTHEQIAAMPEMYLTGANRLQAIRDLATQLRTAATVAHACKLLGTERDLCETARSLDGMADTMESAAC
jgi:hypothetical protein